MSMAPFIPIYLRLHKQAPALHSAGRTDEEIAKELRCSKSYVVKWRVGAGLSANRSFSHKTASKQSELNSVGHRLWLEGKTDPEIAKVIGCCKETVQKWRSKLGLEPNNDPTTMRRIRAAKLGHASRKSKENRSTYNRRPGRKAKVKPKRVRPTVSDDTPEYQRHMSSTNIGANFTNDEREFLQAIIRWKQANPTRVRPTDSEVLSIAKSLGYQKVEELELWKHD